MWPLFSVTEESRIQMFPNPATMSCIDFLNPLGMFAVVPFFK